ncbi:MAG: SPOR domain-containing protein [Thiohalophilus sp.]|uniref:SPOR domain-containing protein n=1 Tax=Thiohalophilus sp. TaxID=3028392 RepID=UPI0028708F4D|nr:SPOR domain-containing protein [Thiohalophilus sp.]MDR9436909.1 SPOR domain-containing protein [Thiohalophilus sp.]
MSSYDAVPLARLEPDYLARYGLQTAPFSSTHDDRFLYLDGERQQLLNMLQHLTRYSELILLVVGERGSGKTSIKQRFIRQADDSYLISEVDAHPMMDADELLSSIAQGFGLIDMPASPAQLQNDLYRYLAGLQQQDRVPVLLVDDAHELPQDALEALFYLADAEAGEGNLLRSVLFCEPAIEVMLESAAIQPLKERVTHRMRIAPFDEEQTAEYLRHRLAVAGLEDTSPFSPREVRRIYKSSGGLPERINDAAHQVLAGGKITSAVDEEEEAPEESLEDEARQGLNPRYIALGGALVILVGAVLWWQEEINRLFDEPAITSSGTEQVAPTPAEPPAAEKIVEFGGDGSRLPAPEAAPGPSREAEPSVSQEEAPVAAQAPETGQAEASAGQTAEPEAPSDESAEPAASDSTAPPGMVKSESLSPALRLESLEPNPVPASERQQTLTLRGEGFDDTTRITVEWGNQRKTLQTSRVTRVDAGRLDFRITVGKKPETWLVVARNPDSGAKDSLQFEVQAPQQEEDTQQDKGPVEKTAEQRTASSPPEPASDWLQRQPADHYTLQLLAAQQRDNLQAFIERHNLSENSAIFESRRNGRPWYAVAYGSFADRDAAQQAIGDLPDGIEPWIRRIGDIQPQGDNAAQEETSTTSITDKPVPRSNALRDHAAWLWDQDPGHYTLQLIAGRNADAVRAFIDRHDLRGQAVFYQTRREGNPWYVVVLGNHADRQAALAAREQLPTSLREQSPWPRPFSDIHADLYRN